VCVQVMCCVHVTSLLRRCVYRSCVVFLCPLQLCIVLLSNKLYHHFDDIALRLLSLLCLINPIVP